MDDIKFKNYFKNNLTKKEQEMLYISFIAYDHDLQRLVCESIINRTYDSLVKTLIILYKMNIDISSKEGFYLAELINFWSSFNVSDIERIIKSDRIYFYSPLMLSHNLKEEEAINIIDNVLININVDKKSFILGIISILKQNEIKFNKVKKIKG